MKQLVYAVLAAIILLMIPQISLAQIQKGQNINGERTRARSGNSVSMPDANTIAIGAPGDSSANGRNSGQVQIYKWNETRWIQKGSDIHGEAANDFSGSSVSMPDANTVAIGANGNDDNGSASGHVRIYRWNGNKWIQKGGDIDGESSDDNSGLSVCMPDPHTVAIGARNAGPNGHVRIYNWDGNKWIQKGADIDGEAIHDNSGGAISMPDANTVAIGATSNDGNGDGSGHVRIYSWNGNKWVQKGEDIDGEAEEDQSGLSVSMPDLNTVAIGAGANEENGANSGHVRIYDWNGNKWVQKGSDINGEAVNDWFGYSVSMPDANTIGIGAINSDGNGESSGHVRIYSWSGHAWVQQGNDIVGEAKGDRSGFAVSMPDTNTVAIGAPRHGENGYESGHVRIFVRKPIGVEKIDISKGITLYPNPTNGIVHIDLRKNLGLLKVTIHNPQGQVLREDYINGSAQSTFDLPQASGMYFITIQALEGLPVHFNILKL